MATIKDIARAANVSTAVVSYVINNGPRAVAPDTRERVLRAMENLNYHPNARAQQFARKRSNCLGLIFNGLSDTNTGSNYFGDEYVRGICMSAERADYNVMLFFNRQPNFYQRVGKSGLVDGVILAGSSLPAAGLARLAETSFPAVVVAQKIPGFSWVTQDYQGATYAATTHLLNQGYTRIGFLGQSLSLSYGQDRLNGYRMALNDAGIPFDPQLVSVPETPRDIPTSHEIDQLISAGADSVLTDKELAVADLLLRRNLHVPQEIALVGLDEERSDSRALAITTIRVPKYELGVAAVETLIALIEKRPDTEARRTLPMQLVIGDSSSRRKRR